MEKERIEKEGGDGGVERGSKGSGGEREVLNRVAPARASALLHAS